MKDDNIYVKKDNGRYVPYGRMYNENYMYDGIWYVRHNENSKSITNVDYMEGLFRVGDRPEAIDVPQLCAMADYTDYVLSSKEMQDLMNKGFSFNDLVSKIVALVIEKNKELKKNSKKNEKEIN